MAFTTLLIANRGEIARRVIRSARRLGYRTVAIHSDADARAPYLDDADMAVRVGPAAASESYLAIDRVIAAATKSGADAIHPGYGFLSENASFARACHEAGITFVGPPPAAIELMADKRAARRAMRAAGVPCVPGFDDSTSDMTRLATEAEHIGYPLLVKAAAGGGGRGMRLVSHAGDLQAALEGASHEAAKAFGSGELLLEKALDDVRHVEVQIFADRHGQVIHLGERDCSVQRRHQKVIEESPSPAVDAALRERMGAAAIAAARAAGYVGAGTVEFLLDKGKSFFFLEMNTRLQVEHAVTEMVTGYDLVEWQLRIAAGEPLPVAQGEVTLSGAAIEARLYAEDPRQGFLPQTGTVLDWLPPEGEGLRVDHALATGSIISSHYDAMVAKIVAHGTNRDEARRKLVLALGATRLFGVTSNKALLLTVSEHEVFARGEATTSFLEHAMAGDPAFASPQSEAEARGFAAAALVLLLESVRGVVDDELVAWRSGGPLWSCLRLACGETEREMRVALSGTCDGFRRFRVGWDQGEENVALEIDLVAHRPGAMTLVVDGLRRTFAFALATAERGEPELYLDDGRGAVVYRDRTHAPAETAAGAGSGRLLAPLDGAVVGLRREPGARVKAGDVVLLLEAMKMEHRVVADIDGTVATVHVAPGDQVRTRQLLVEITPFAEAGAG
jgi:geranyl-CoA carboxylase alpha subunit